ncbi:NADH dehydrogenase subunit M [Desulfitobacterium sp. LBE]|uniref:NADH dehydrogenase I chain M n=5 Tax=root TaxID=1 RepID=Q24UC4_DESHY|nr:MULTISPECIES: NADH-quinone oxidoreductase subunit M [Desulfitobacterium]ACL21758.1 proton-translocating NADH-quinone oxidoreductase, chain M [Desulfitobacterium hafniense DCB-2]EHL06312.1 proton-translocating NADH-quinone oxidoreductase, chain M [Desulfitobacterium hafniense DP7]KTE90230.1 NADH dehydrogenase [Desulfitobacterium hafniense]MEA5024675.1 NADH-quinone oxidoreductase subunit M [Desulfitobacterium hafniense]TWH60468.1 NADH dehydrogenase subunit M [Desulfitobacterium sp. LBE]
MSPLALQPEVGSFILPFALLAPILAAFIIVFLPKEEGKTIKLVAALGTLTSLLLSLYVFFAYDRSLAGMQFNLTIPLIPDIGVNLAFGVDGISIPMLLLTNLIAFTAVYSSWNIENRVKEFFVLLLILIAGVMGTFIARDLFIFFLFYEIVVIPIYIMVIIWGSTKRVTKEYAGMKLTIYLLLGSALLLVAMVSLWVNATNQLAAMGQGPTFMFDELARLQYDETFQIICFGLLAVGFGSLISMFPFHSWSPDGYAGAPTAVSMIHAGVLKKIGGYGLIRLGLMVFPLGAKFWAPVIAVLAVVNVLYAAFIALAQKDLKYVVGYSSVSHMGYVLIAVAALNITSINGAVAMMFAHGVMSALFFSMIGFIYEKTHTRNIAELGGLAHQMPRLAVGFLLAGMAGLGLPGTVNFIGEFTIFIGTVKVLPVHAVVGIAGIIFTAVYSLRLIANVLFGPRRKEWDHLKDLRGPELVPLVVLVFVIIITGVFPNTVLQLIDTGVQSSGLAKVLEAVTQAKMGGLF